jgi:hypothetical protein
LITLRSVCDLRARYAICKCSSVNIGAKRIERCRQVVERGP